MSAHAEPKPHTPLPVNDSTNNDAAGPSSRVHPAARSLLRRITPQDNPFLTTTPITGLELVKVLLSSVCLLPLVRFCLSLVFFLFATLFAFLTTLGLPVHPTEPLSGFRRALSWCFRYLIRVMCFFWGLSWISSSGDVPAHGTYRAVVANHVTMCDWLPFILSTGCSVAIKKEMFDMWIIGRWVRAVQALPVDRSSREARQASKRMIEARLEDPAWPPLLIFPEGTTTNNEWLIRFNKGVFDCGQPVLPAVVRVPHCHYDAAMTPDYSDVFHLWRFMCQVYNVVQVKYLPTYVPSEAEKADGALFADNVRNLMAAELGARVTDHSFDDLRLRWAAARAKIKEVDFIYADMRRITTYDLNTLKDLTQRFRELDSSQDGLLQLDEFCKLLELQNAPRDQCERLFHIFDADGSGAVDFGEFVLGVAMVSGHLSHADMIELTFHTCDHAGDGQVSRAELERVLNVVAKEFDNEAEQLIAELFPDNDSDAPPATIDADDFRGWLAQHPDVQRAILSHFFGSIVVRDEEHVIDIDGGTLTHEDQEE